MSRVAKNPVAIPSGIEVKVNAQHVSIKGSKGVMEHTVHKLVSLVHEDNELRVAPTNTSKSADSLAGTSRAVLSNMVHGVSEGFQKKLTIIGVGYRAAVQGKVLDLTLGFSHPVKFDIPEGITIETPTATEVVVSGIDKQLVGQVAANIRAYRPPEPYKGKGVRYSDEHVVRKEAKKT